jgi:pyruvate/2-oxoglutarate dehydrogenase complex dihydrolipoamide dehydrogenase (E3) component
LFIAVGAEPLRPSSIPGIDKPHVHWAPEADQGLIEVGQNVVVIGAGAVGVESALFQHDQGKNVSIYEMASHTGNLSTSAGVGAFVLEKELAEKGLAINLNHKLHEITDDAVLLIDLRSNDLVRIPADTVLLALGMRSRDQEVARFRHSAPETDVFVIGDCKVVGNVGTSNSSAFGASYDY